MPSEIILSDITLDMARVPCVGQTLKKEIPLFFYASI